MQSVNTNITQVVKKNSIKTQVNHYFFYSFFTILCNYATKIIDLFTFKFVIMLCVILVWISCQPRWTPIYWPIRFILSLFIELTFIYAKPLLWIYGQNVIKLGSVIANICHAEVQISGLKLEKWKEKNVFKISGEQIFVSWKRTVDEFFVISIYGDWDFLSWCFYCFCLLQIVFISCSHYFHCENQVTGRFEHSLEHN